MVGPHVRLGAALVFAVAAAVTVAMPRWIEAVFGVDVDGGTGALEWCVVAVFAAISAACGLLARRAAR